MKTFGSFFFQTEYYIARVKTVILPLPFPIGRYSAAYVECPEYKISPLFETGLFLSEDCAHDLRIP